MLSGLGLPEDEHSLVSVNALAEMLPDGLVVAGPEAEIRFVNTEACRILDCEPEVLLGEDVREALAFTDKHGRDWWSHTDPWNGIASRTGHRERLLVAPGGREVLVTARYVRTERGGSPVRVMLGLRDAEARLRAEQDQASVLSTVAHELRAPLTSVKGFTSSLLRRWDRFTDEQKRLMIETIESDASRLTRLITELLDISRLDAGRLSLRLGPVNLHERLERHVVRHELGRAAGSIRLVLGPRARREGLPELWADGDRLEQVFFNLIENALRHGAGLVTVTVERDRDVPDGVRVCVEDEGEGVPLDYRDRIFERFWHDPTSVSTGLGLYVVRGLVEAHGGTVHVEDAERGGARFVVHLRSAIPEHVV
jgi:signal transduction histidine kinase